MAAGGDNGSNKLPELEIDVAPDRVLRPGVLAHPRRVRALRTDQPTTAHCGSGRKAKPCCGVPVVNGHPYGAEAFAGEPGAGALGARLAGPGGHVARAVRPGAAETCPTSGGTCRSRSRAGCRQCSRRAQPPVRGRARHLRRRPLVEAVAQQLPPPWQRAVVCSSPKSGAADDLAKQAAAARGPSPRGHSLVPQAKRTIPINADRSLVCRVSGDTVEPVAFMGKVVSFTHPNKSRIIKLSARHLFHHL